MHALTPEFTRACDEALAAGGALVKLAVRGECPYPGLAAFEERHARWFHGRTAALAALIGALEKRMHDRTGPLLVVGPSGAGKSSLLRAGLLPALARGDLTGLGPTPAAVFTPTASPARQLAEQRARDRGEPTVWVVDQLEEIFTLCPDEDEQRSFLDALCAEAGPGGSRVVVLGVRADFYGHCLAHDGLLVSARRGHLPLGPMSRRELVDAVREPARAAGLELEPGLLELLLNDLGLRGDDPGDCPDPGVLPLLAHTLRALWQQRSGRTLTIAGYRAITEQTDAVNALAFSPDGATLAAAGDDGAVRQWETASGRPRFQPMRLHSPVLGVAYSADGTYIAACARDRVIRLWRRDGSDQPRQLSGVHQAAVIHVTFSPDSRTLVSTSDDHTAVLWDTTTGQTVRTLRADDAVFDAAFNTDGSLLATASYDHTVQLWDPTTGDLVQRLPAHNERVMGVAFSPDGHWLASVGMDGNAALWDLAGAVQMSRPWTAVHGMATSPDGTWLVTGDSNGVVRTWRRHPHTRDGRDLRLVRQQQLPPQAHAVWQMAFCPDGRTVGIVTDSPRVRLLDTPTGQLSVLDGGTGSARTIACDHAGMVLSTDDPGQTRIWDARTQRQLLLLDNLVPRALAVDPQGRFLARPAPGRVELRDLTGQPLTDSAAFQGVDIALAAALSPDSTLLAAALSDHSVQVWQLHQLPGHRFTLTAVRRLLGPSANPEALTFSPDGHTLAAAGDDSAVQLWDTRTWQHTATLTGPTGRITSLAFTPDSTALVSTGDDGLTRFWDLDIPRAFQHACQVASWLTRTEWAEQITGPYVPACRRAAR
ncbi:hypothetical protein ACFOSC_15140 [Streptantibioticus rubrisoli]|uniref:Novel STAND NTPase 1 domain-containing protein n=1 Tax=Streptantibioticus rubrisoli TaxID=1387313 RepID=A0ABT1P9H7_9ACTN|nr:WD40 repeat domain-containing protein [Streptantibioticus rubrisoli]MCQ4042019.1 hypothetical protein [Streptantibioticus rubrisoli]